MLVDDKAGTSGLSRGCVSEPGNCFIIVHSTKSVSVLFCKSERSTGRRCLSNAGFARVRVHILRASGRGLML